LRYLFGDYTLDADRRELCRAGQPVHVEPQVFDLLLYVIRNRDRVVTRDDLIAGVWGGRIVAESTLGNRINAARHAIGDSGERQQFIRTIARRGIMFVGDVREEDGAGSFRASEAGASTSAAPAPASNPDAAATRDRAALPLPDKPSIAVLPFANLSDDPQQEYFCDGMAEEITTAISRCGWLFVIARNSSFTYKGKAVDVRQVGRELGVRYVLEGSVRRAGERVRLAAQLIEAATGAQLWADRFDGEMRDVFELQDRITENVVGAIEPRLQRAEIERLRQKPAASLDAYDFYLRALQQEYLCTEESLDEAIRCLRRAAEIDPSYAPAMALAAYCYAIRAFQAWAKDYDAEAAEAVRLANRAVELAPDDQNVLWMAAYPIWFLGKDPLRAQELFGRSLAINPNSPMALTMSCWLELPMGNFGKARENVERARRLSPRDPREWLMSTTVALTNLWERKFADCLAWCDKAVTQNSRSLPALRTKIVALVNLGRREEAVKVVQTILSVDPTFTIASWQKRNPSAHHMSERFKFMVDAYRAAGVPE
jgi:TolB-like protein